MKARIQKWGNSLALRIPNNLAKEAQLKEGSEVTLVEQAGKITFRRIEHEASLDELVDQITEDNMHAEEDFGPQRGREIW